MRLIVSKVLSVSSLWNSKWLYILAGLLITFSWKKQEKGYHKKWQFISDYFQYLDLVS